jgi:uncharacterized protein YbjT (DUF2867 family)
VAAVAAQTLNEDGHAGDDYVLTGPESLSQAEQVSIHRSFSTVELIFAAVALRD